MVKLNLDTKRDAVDDLEEAIELLQRAVTERKVSETVDEPGEKPSAQELVEETAVDTGWLKISVETEEPPEEEEAPSDPISEGELTELFEKHEKKEKKEPEEELDADNADEYIEIIEVEDD